MTWTAIPDTFPTDPRLLECSRDARLLHVEALVYCNQHLTDGALPHGALPRITDSPDPSAAVTELESVGLWSPVADRNVWQVEWKDQEPSSEVERRRAITRARVARHRAHKSGDHSRCIAKFCNALHVTPSNASNALVTPSPPLPSQEGGGGGAARGAAAPPPASQTPPVVTPEPLPPERNAEWAERARAGLPNPGPKRPPREARRIQEPEPVAASLAEVVEDLTEDPDEDTPPPSPPPVVESKNEAPPAPALERTEVRSRSMFEVPPEVAEGITAYERATASLAGRKW